MITGIYVSAAGMAGQVDRQDVIANNLANCSTPAFKKSSISFSALSAGLARFGTAGKVEHFIPVPVVRQDTTQGLMDDTDSPTHLAIDGPGFFVVKTPYGERLSRNGSFKLDDSGQLVAEEGSPVMGSEGPIRITSGNWTVEQDGSVRVDGRLVDKLRIETIAGERPEEGEPMPGRVVRNRIERSNANAIQEMVSMITGLRAYEAGQRVIQALDQTLDKAINQLSRHA